MSDYENHGGVEAYVNSLNEGSAPEIEFREKSPIGRTLERYIPSLSDLNPELRKILNECTDIKKELPEGANALVIGSGPNSQEWRGKGWLTLDIDPESGADVIGDANTLHNEVATSSMDYVLAEFIRNDPMGREGVTPAAMLAQTNKVLKMGGKFILETASIETAPDTTLPHVYDMASQLKRHGFRGVADIQENVLDHPDGIDRLVTYYCEKVRDGYKTDTGDITLPIPETS